MPVSDSKDVVAGRLTSKHRKTPKSPRIVKPPKQIRVITEFRLDSASLIDDDDDQVVFSQAPATRSRPGPSEFKEGKGKAQEHRAFMVRDLKTLDDNAGIFEGYVAVFNNLDGNGDVIDRGAFTKTLREAHEVKERNRAPYLFPVLWQHNEREPIGGIIEAHEDDHGLYIRGQYDVDTELGKRAYSGAKKGYLRGLSIGYDAVKSVHQRDARHLLEIRLWEGSPVTYPANTEAMITAVKSASGKADWPLADRDLEWDSGAAHKRLLDWAGGDNFDQSKMQSVHFWYDQSAPDKLGSYKLPFCDVINGSVKAVPRAIFAVAGVLQGARGGADLGKDEDAVRAKVTAYYGRMSKQFNDDTIVPPWSAKAQNMAVRAELKQATGLTALLGAAQCLSNCSDSAAAMAEALAEACGMSLDGSQAYPPAPAVAAMLAGVDGLEDAIKAVFMACQEFEQQSDALMSLLDLDDSYGGDIAVPMYMSQLRSALEMKTGRAISTSNAKRIQGVIDGLHAHASELKSMLHDNDADLAADENTPANDYGDVIASGHHNPPKSLDRKGREPARSTLLSTALREPVGPDAQATLADLTATLMDQQLDLLKSRRTSQQGK